MEESNFDERIKNLEADVGKLKDDVHKMKNDQMSMQGQLGAIDTKIDKVLTWVEGTDKVFGFCRKHWRTILKFGLGFISAYGLSNPKVAHEVEFIGKFFGV